MSAELDQRTVDQCGPGLSANTTRIIGRLLDAGYELTHNAEKRLEFCRHVTPDHRRTVTLWLQRGGGGSRRVRLMTVLDLTSDWRLWLGRTVRTADIDAWLDQEAQP